MDPQKKKKKKKKTKKTTIEKGFSLKKQKKKF